jgi:hypothetical protein
MRISKKGSWQAGAWLEHENETADNTKPMKPAGNTGCIYVKVTVNVYSRMSLDWLSMSFRLYVPF